MIRFGRFVAKHRILILILGLLLLIPSILGFIGTRVNYDILSYLPSDIDTMVGQDILIDQFGKGGFSMVVIEGMDDKDVSALREKYEAIDGVASAVWYDTLADPTIPKEILPDKYYDVFNNGDATLMIVFFSGGTSDEQTMNAINEMRRVSDKQAFISGMSAVVTDTKQLCEQEEPIYVLIAVVLCALVLAITMDSFLLPVLFLLSIGMAILYNLGSNYFLGEISYITKALSAVLQLGVTMDYSIFLWHSYSEQCQHYDDRVEAMAHAITATISSVVGSSLTTVAGFIALCFMSFTLGLDLGVVMAKGVVFGVIACVTILPSMILVFDKAIVKTTHRSFFPDLGRLSSFITKHYKVFIGAFLILLIPAIWGYQHTGVYYNLDSSLPSDLDCIVANEKLANDFDMGSTHMLLINADTSAKDIQSMSKQMEDVDGVSFVLGLDTVVGGMVPQDFLPDSVTGLLESDQYKLLLIGSNYKVATDEVGSQITQLESIAKHYDDASMLIGEAPCTKDLIAITDHDFKVVSIVSIAAVFVIIALVLKSISLPVILVAIIEFAIFINMGIPAYTGATLPFIASVVIGTIQLGATVDYAILMTNRYLYERKLGKHKREAIGISIATSAKSISVSALGFFAATFGVGLYSNIDLISSLCSLMARGALISMCVVVFILPSALYLFDRVILATTLGTRHIHKQEKAQKLQEVKVS